MTLFHPSETFLFDGYRICGDTAEVTVDLAGIEHKVVYEGPDAVDLLLSDAKVLTDAAAELAIFRTKEGG